MAATPSYIAFWLAGTALCWMLPSGSCRAQSWSFAPEAVVGRTLAVQDFLRGGNLAGRPLRRFTGGGLTVYHRPAQSPEWAARYGFPLVGFGVRRIYLDSPQELGHATILHRTFRGPFKTYRRGSLEYVSAVGVAWGLRRYDYHVNPHNLLISTAFSAYVQLGVGWRYALSDQFSLLGNVSLHHFSNGNFKRPNLGLNAVAGTLALQYRAAKYAAPVPAGPASSFARHTAINLVLFGASERRVYYSPGLPYESFYRGMRHPVAGLSVAAERRMSPKYALGFGATLVYRPTGTIGVHTEDGRVVRTEAGFDPDQIRLGVFPSYVQHFGRIAVIVQPEFYIYQRGSPSPNERMSQRLGFRYRVSERLYAGIAVNAHHFSVADFVEWRVGYRIARTSKAQGGRRID